MTVIFNRDIFFDSVRASLFGGNLSQQQVDGMNFKLDVWEERYADLDLRWLAYPLATSYHETAQKMWPIEEYGKGAGMPYGKIDPETGQAYYGRGDVQLTHRSNYKRATTELGIQYKSALDLEWHAENALNPTISAGVMYIGMFEGWFRKSRNGEPETLARYFNDDVNDAFTAREIINGDKTKVPSWSNGVSIGNLIKGYHGKFLTALIAARIAPAPSPETLTVTINVAVDAPPGVEVKVNVIG
jgi:hypothetical protein